MRSLPTTRVRWLRPWALLAMALHGGTAVVTPLVHAQSEVAQATRELETEHSSQCPRIHTDADFLSCATSLFAVPSVRFRAPTLDARTHRSRPAIALSTPSQAWSKSHPVRAPPAR